MNLLQFSKKTLSAMREELVEQLVDAVRHIDTDDNSKGADGLQMARSIAEDMFDIRKAIEDRVE